MTALPESDPFSLIKDSVSDDVHYTENTNNLQKSDIFADLERDGGNLKDMNSLSDDDAAPIIVPKKRTQHFTDSDSDEHNISKCVDLSPKNTQENGNSQRNTPEPDSYSNNTKENKLSRIKRIDSSDSECSSPDKYKDAEDNLSVRKSIRQGDKEISLKDKFKKMLSRRKTAMMSSHDEENKKPSPSNSESDDEFSCIKIKQKFKSGSQVMKSICDPDTSDEEDNIQVKSFKRKSKPKMTKPTSPKPMKMTAKQALENKQKIKSESNRMLREKGVSLPYHRPKALTLKDIMSRRKPAVSADGKTLPIKMNEDQLREYAMLLEQRQKEVIELCKSDTEDDDKEETNEDKVTNENEEVTNENEEVTNENKGVTNVSTNTTEGTTEIITESISNCTKEVSNLENCLNSDLNTIDKSLESSGCIDSAIESESPKKNVTDSISDIDSEKNESEEIQKSVTEESQEISLLYDSAKNIGDDIDSKTEKDSVVILKGDDEDKNDEFSDCDINMDEIDKLIEQAESYSITNGQKPIPKLNGAPGTLINFDDEETAPKKLSGVELLKERFTFFAKIKTLEDIEKDREKKYKPGTQHLKLKQELEEQIAEQRSLEWEKRLLEEQQLKSEMNVETGEDDIEKLESKMEEIEKEENEVEVDVSESEEELVEDDVVMEDKPKKRNPMLDDEAEVSDDENCDEVVDESDDESNEDSEDSSSDSDDGKPKKGRILKAFEDSDDEKELEPTIDDVNKVESGLESGNGDVIINESQDDELPLAQMNKSSDDLFSTQSTDLEPGNVNGRSVVLSTGLSNSDLSTMIRSDINPDNMDVCGTKNDNDVMDIVGTCSENSSQNPVSSQMLPGTSSQEFGDDILDMCTGKFYENPLVSQETTTIDTVSEEKQKNLEKETLQDKENDLMDNVTDLSVSNMNEAKEKLAKENTVLNSILDELDDLDEKPKQNKYFANDAPSKDLRKKFVIESDDELNDNSPKKVKKLKKKKAEQRALHISDDEEEEEDNAESDIEEDDDRIVEYDSEENEIEVKQPKPKSSKKGMNDFFEDEAELTSEDEWVGSGDEDERGLDRMEREEGDDDTFHQEQLQRELGQIHMREVLDQDKREVRLIQELLFEDGDLGDGHRQRKFRWRNADGEEETGTYPEQLTDTQEDEFESEEQWRKERHEREMFIRQMREKDEDANISINRSTIIKANLSSKSVSSLITEIKTKPVEKAAEKKTAKDIPSPKKGFTIFQQNYHTSLLTRGRGALARLAALATPLADDDTPRNITNNRGNFVFAAINPDENSKVPTKRKAETIHTPRLIKKLKTENSNIRKPSLFDHIKI